MTTAAHARAVPRVETRLVHAHGLAALATLLLALATGISL